jgi:hypothetical protein
MKKIGDLLKTGKVEQKISREEKRNELLDTCWRVCMGEACSSHTKRLCVKDGKLTVFMDSQAWQQELMFTDKQEIVDKMARETGLIIVDVKIKTGG